ncbi:MAG: alanine racemase [Actinomycetes bacterium]
MTERARAQIDLDALRANVSILHEAAPTAALLAVVKADAYGHGLVECSKAAVSAGASYLGVALAQEAIALRQASITTPILAWLLQTDSVDEWVELVLADVEVSVSSVRGLQKAIEAANQTGTTARIHLKVDTGMGRAGASLQAWEGLLRDSAQAVAEQSIEVVGVWTHLAFADQPENPIVEHQLEVFHQALGQAESLGIKPALRHVANSAATFKTPKAHFDMVRPGIAVYGLSPGVGVGTSQELGIRPVMTFSANVIQVKELPAGHGVSYGHEYVTTTDTSVALLPVGYADGVPLAGSNVGPILIGSRARTIAGRVCMDQVVVDIGTDQVVEGDEAIFFGPGDAGEPTADDWASAANTIGYEIVTRIGPRVPRIFSGGGT